MFTFSVKVYSLEENCRTLQQACEGAAAFISGTENRQTNTNKQTNKQGTETTKLTTPKQTKTGNNKTIHFVQRF